FQLARYRRVEFGRFSEKLAREAGQLGLARSRRWRGTRRRGWRRPRPPLPQPSRPRRSAEAAAPPIARTPSQRRSAASRTMHLPWLRRRAAQSRRRGHRDPRLRARPVQGDPAHSSKALLPGLRHGGGGAGADHAIARGRAGAGLLERLSAEAKGAIGMQVSAELEAERRATRDAIEE